MMTESFGMQLDDDSLLALYHVHDPAGCGCLAYEPLVRGADWLQPVAYSVLLCRQRAGCRVQCSTAMMKAG